MFKYSFEFEEWPAVHSNTDKLRVAYNGSIFKLRDNYNTIFEEYQSSREPDDSELGIICQECEHPEDPDEFRLRLESRVMNQYENN